MKQKFYFEDSNSEICYTKKYFQQVMKKTGLSELEVFEAVPINDKGVFWCKKHLFGHDDSSESCGKVNCDEYYPRNRISGRCRFHNHITYTHGEKIKLKS